MRTAQTLIALILGVSLFAILYRGERSDVLVEPPLSPDARSTSSKPMAPAPGLVEVTERIEPRESTESVADRSSLVPEPAREPEAASTRAAGPVEPTANVFVQLANGEPAAGVEVLAVRPSANQPPRFDVARSQEAVYTDELGRAKIAVGRRHTVAARVIHGPLVFGDESDPHRITLPDVGTVHVNMELPLDVTLDGADYVPRVTVFPFRLGIGGGRDLGLGTIEAPGGEATLFPVAVDAPFRVKALADGWMGSSVSEGLEDDGQELNVTVSMDPIPTLRFTALDTDGHPIAHAEFGVRINAEREVEHSGISTSEGRVACQLPGYAQKTPIQSVFVREIVDSKDVNDGRIAVVKFQPTIARDTDLGAVTMRPVPVVVSGRVVDADGEGVARATVRIEHVIDPAGVLGRSSKSPAFPGSPEHAQARADKTGHFEVRMGLPDGSLPQGLHTLHASRRSAMTPAPVEFYPGTEDLVVEILPAGRLRFDTSSYAPSQMAGAVLTLHRRGSASFSTSVPWGHDRVSYRLRPGIYSLSVSAGWRQDVPVVEGLELRSGQSLEDPRLVPLDISAVLQIRQVQVRCATGMPPASFDVRPKGNDLNKRSTNISIEDGVARIPCWVESEPTTYEIQAQGFLSFDLPSIVEGDVLQLREGIATRLQLAGAELPGTPIGLYIRPGESRQSELNGPTGPVERIQFDEAGRANWKASRPGPHFLWIPGRQRDAKKARWREATVVVPEEGGAVNVLPKAP